MDHNARQLRQQARHCRQLAEAHYDEQIRAMLRTMAEDFDEQALQKDAVAVRELRMGATLLDFGDTKLSPRRET